MQNILIDQRTVKKIIRKHKTNAPELLRLFLICQNTFYNRSGLFAINQLLDALHLSGHKSLNKKNTSNRSKKSKELKSLILSCPDLFFYSGNNIFRVNSKYAIHRRKPSWRMLSADIILKKNKRLFYDLVIGINADGKNIDYSTLAAATGYTQARCCQAMQSNDKNGHIYKINNLIVVQTFTSRADAAIFRIQLFKQYRVFSKVVKNKSSFSVVVYGANSYSSDMKLTPINGASQSIILNKRHDSNVFYKDRFSGLCYFKDAAAEQDYFWRRSAS